MAEEKLVQREYQLASLNNEEQINILASSATELNYAFSFYRMPGEESIHFIAGKELKRIDHEDLSTLGAGFLISSFEGQHYYFDKEVAYAKNLESENIERLFEKGSVIKKTKWQPYIVSYDNEDTMQNEYINNVRECISVINATELIKVVPSRTRKVKLDNALLPEIFIKLCQSYPTAFVSITSTPELGTWVGATPETLIEVDEQGIFKTMSLAGTQKYNGEALHTLPWTQKEIEEQAMVSRYIINRFKEIRLREFVEVGPKTVSAGNMAHLCSTFTVDTIATDFANLGSVMLGLLHPTSAVCGMPKEAAKKLIKKIEKHDRRLFSGYLGPVNMDNGSYIYVNLRCMEIQEDFALLYAGAGVTEYSVPEDEWHETELKCNTLRNIIEQ